MMPVVSWKANQNFNDGDLLQDKIMKTIQIMYGDQNENLPAPSRNYSQKYIFQSKV